MARTYGRDRVYSLEERHFSLSVRSVSDNPLRRLGPDMADVELAASALASNSQIYLCRESLDACGRTHPVLITVMRGCHVKSRQVL